MGSEEGAEELVQMNVLCRTTYEKRGAAGARVGGRARVCGEGVARRKDRDVGCVARTRASGSCQGTSEVSVQEVRGPWASFDEIRLGVVEGRLEAGPMGV